MIVLIIGISRNNENLSVQFAKLSFLKINKKWNWLNFNSSDNIYQDNNNRNNNNNSNYHKHHHKNKYKINLYFPLNILNLNFSIKIEK